LFSALAKIVGIPTKLITGLVYVGGPDGIFGYHQWVEVWLGDRWIAMDPTFGQHVADPTHIKFTEGLSDADGLRDAGVAASELFGDMKLKVIEYRTIDGIRKRL
jgi:transglutaminase-like putative cysteine protease